MSRIRTIKPEFWSSEQIISCSPMARLLFIGLWNFSDDGGIHPASCISAKAQVFPADNIDLENIRKLIDELISNELLFEYQVDKKKYWAITGWNSHQKIDRPHFRYPTPKQTSNSIENREPIDDLSGNSRRSFDDHSTIDRRSFDDQSPPEGKGREGNGRERQLNDSSSSLKMKLPEKIADAAAEKNKTVFDLARESRGVELVDPTFYKNKLPPEWEAVDFSKLEEIGFSQSKLFQIFKSGKHSPEDAQLSLNNLADYLLESPKEQPLAYIMRIFQTGEVFERKSQKKDDKPANSLPPSRYDVEDEIRKSKARTDDEKLKNKNKNDAFLLWESKLTEAQKEKIYPVVKPPMFTTAIKSIYLRNYYNNNVNKD